MLPPFYRSDKWRSESLYNLLKVLRHKSQVTDHPSLDPTIFFFFFLMIMLFNFAMVSFQEFQKDHMR